MRIAMITGEYPPMEGGVGDFTYKLGRSLATSGHEIHILTTMHPDDTGEQVAAIKIYRNVEAWGWAAHTKITRWIEAIKPDVVNIQYQAAAYQMRGAINLYPRWQGRRIEPPLVTTFHDLRPPYLFPKAGPLRKWAVHQMANYCHGVIVTNGEDYTELNQNLGEKKKPRIKLIHIGSNIAPNPPDGYERNVWRREHGIEDNDLLLGFFGFLNASKGVETLLKAMPHLLERNIPAHLIFIGGRTGSSDITNRKYAASIDALIADLGLDTYVHHTGFTRPPVISAALLASDICVLPYRDGVSLRRGTLHACLAHGRPIVTTKPSTPIEELQDGEQVLTVSPGDAEAVADAILRLQQTPDVRKRLSKNAAILADEFSWERIAAHTAEFFRQLSA